MLNHWTQWLVLIQVICIFTLLLSMLGQKFSWLPFPSGFLLFGLSLLLMLIVGVVGLVLLIISVFNGASEWRMPSALALLVGLAPLVFSIMIVGADKLRVPPIHDISTDFDHNLEFSAALADRSDSANSLSADEKVMAAQRQAYPDVQALILQQSPEQVFDRALTLVKERQWQVLREDKIAGEIEAVDVSALFGFKDDVIIRVQTQKNGSGSRVDMRSASRVGQSDLGANQQRIQAFLQDLNQN